MTQPNALQIQDWNGVVGERWAAEQESMDGRIRPFGEAALRAAQIQPGEVVADIGCGCGDTSLAIARGVGALGRVVGVDVSAPMLAVAARRAAGLPNLTFLQADAARADLPGPFDLLYSRFGVMFFDDPAAAFARLRSVLKPGGRIAFACWQEAKANPWAYVPALAVREAASLPASASDPHAPGPFALGDGRRTQAILETSGFTDVRLEGYEAPFRLGSTPRAAAEASLRIGPASRLAREADPARLPAVLAGVEAALLPYAAVDGSIALAGRVWIITARTD